MSPEGAICAKRANTDSVGYVAGANLSRHESKFHQGNIHGLFGLQPLSTRSLFFVFLTYPTEPTHSLLSWGVISARFDIRTKGERMVPRVQYLIDELTFHREQGSRRQQLETLLTQRGDEGWELVSMMTPEAQAEDTSAGVRVIRSANLLLVFKRV
jgi:hypothetical protein